MLLFEYVLILLAVICLSNVVYRFVPIVSVPIIQIALGALVTLLPFDFQFELDPELFFVLFIAPVLFYISMLADKKTMWAQRKPILNAGVLLVLVTIISVGYLVNFLIPTIPLFAAFALIAALGTTDDVAVTSIGKRVSVPPKMLSILQGESIVNDASGIVGFQFAIAAMLTGSFSVLHATGRLFVVGLGGIAVGLLLSWFKYLLVRWIRSLGMENITLHLMLGLLTPFVVFMVAEKLEVSGILAVCAAGIAHSFNRDKFNPEKVNLKIASESVWSMFSFTLEGLVFVIMGTQLPQILTSIKQNHSITRWEIIAYILLLTLLLLIIRFIWSIVAIRKKTYDDPEYPINRFRAGIIFSLSGARGAITLASIMSIPLFMSDGTAFPERDLIILIAGSIIVVSLLITNFILPLCIEKKVGIDKSVENEAYLEILQNVIAELQKRITPENEAATALISANYHDRIVELQRKQVIQPVDNEVERKFRITFCQLEKEHVTDMLEHGETDETTAQYYLSVIDNQMNELSKNRFAFGKNTIRFLFHNHWGRRKEKQDELHARVIALMIKNVRFVLEKIRATNNLEENLVIKKMAADYELILSMYQRGLRRSKPDNESLTSVVSHAFHAERENINIMLEAGRISRETAKNMRHNISLLEVQLKKDFL